MNLLDLVDRVIPPAPWTEGDNIPWNEPGFSKRMLAEHLSQDHDLASRRRHRIDAQADWLQRSVLPPPPARILDLACGPGLYMARLAEAGFTGAGIDFSPASIAYARAGTTKQNVDYREDDLRTAELGTGYNVVLLLYGQFNVFRRDEAASIVRRAHSALEPGGVLVLEPQSFAHIKTTASSQPSWNSSAGGLFSDRPHLTLTESFWNDETRTGTQRFFIVDAETGKVARHSLSNEAYTDAELKRLLFDTGFEAIKHWPSLTGEAQDDGLEVVVGVRTA